MIWTSNQGKNSFSLLNPVLMDDEIDPKTKRTFKPHGAIAFDNRILSYNFERKEVSIWTMEGRQRMTFTAGKR